jgi:hypothetical protein
MLGGAIPVKPCSAQYCDTCDCPGFVRRCSSAACDRKFAEQEKRKDLKKAIAAASAAVATQVPTLSWDFQPLSFDQYAAPGANNLEFLEKLAIQIAERAYCSPGAALRRLFRAISYSIWSDQALAVLARQPLTFVYPSPSKPSSIV